MKHPLPCLVTLLALGLTLDASAAELAYRFKGGSNYVYAITISATEPDYIETVTGTAVYKVRKASASEATIEVDKHLRTERRDKAGGSVRLPGSGFDHEFHAGPFRLAEFGGSRGPFQRPHTLRVDSRGWLLEESGTDSLPRALGDLSQLMIVPLPEKGLKKWDSENRCSIILEEKEWLTPSRRLYRRKDVRLASTETEIYEISGESGDTTTIKKTYELKTREKVNGEPRMALAGSATITFDRAAGVATALKFAGRLVENSPSVTVRTPIVIETKLLSGREAVEGAKPVTSNTGVRLTGGKEMSEAEMVGLIKDLKSDDKHKKRMAAGRLLIARPDGHQREITRLLLGEMGDADKFYRQNISGTLAKWADKESLPELLKLLDDSHFMVRWNGLDAVGRVGDAGAAKVLAGKMESAANNEFLKFSNAFVNIGPAAEDAVLGLLESKNITVLREACRVLKQIGSKRSVAKLEGLSSHSDGIVKMFAKQAVAAAEKR